MSLLLDDRKQDTAFGHSHPECAGESVSAIGADMKVGISSFAAWMLGVGAMIGSYAWLVHGPMIARAGSFATVMAWLAAAIASLPVAFICAELSSMFPSAGGPYVFKYYAFKRLVPKHGELIGFSTGWLFYICVLTGLACMANGFSNLLSTTIFGGAQASPIWFAPLTITLLYLSCTALNTISVDKASFFNNLATAVKFVMAISFAALIIASPGSSVDYAMKLSNLQGSTNFFANFSSVFLIALSGYAGIEISACAGSETKNASKAVPRAILLTLITTACFYVGMSFAVGAAAPYGLDKSAALAVIPGTSVQATCPALVGHLLGNFWGTIMTAAVVASIFGCGFGCILSCARVGYSMAKTGLFPQKFAQLNEKTRIPQYALWFQFYCLLVLSIGANVLARTGLCPDAYVFMGEVFGFMYSIIALMYGFCLISLRYTDPQLARPFRLGSSGNGLAWLMTFTACLVYGFAAFCCTGLFQQLTGVLLLLSGIPIYVWYRRQRLPLV